MTKVLRLLAALAVPALLAACASAPASTLPSSPQPVMSGEVFDLDVAEVTVLQAGAPESGTVVDLRATVDDWARRHLRPAGASGRIKVSVNNASIRESIYRRTAPGGTSFERIRQFDGLVDLKFDATDIRTQRSGFAGATVSRTDSLPYSASSAEIDHLTARLTDAMLRDLLSAVEASLHARLGRFVK